MSNQNQTKQMAAPSRRGRGCLLWLGRTVLLFLGLVAAGAIYETAAEAYDSRAYPPPGKLVDVGGYRLHINCTGTGSPTVVIDAGLGDWSTMWSWVQPEVAKTTRVCTYDRAGSGWSDAGPLPRTAQVYAQELHTLLHNAEIAGPYVIVGHSMGGLPAVMFAHDYPTEVAGLVLIESMSPPQFSHSTTNAATLPAAASPALTPLPILGRLGIVRLLARPLGLIPALPKDVQPAYLARLVRPLNMQAVTDEMQGMPASASQVEAVTTIGSMPLIVLTSRSDHNPPGWQTWQAELPKLSSNSQQLFAEKGGHNIELEEPDAAVSAIVKMVEQVRQ